MHDEGTQEETEYVIEESESERTKRHMKILNEPHLGETLDKMEKEKMYGNCILCMGAMTCTDRQERQMARADGLDTYCDAWIWRNENGILTGGDENDSRIRH